MKDLKSWGRIAGLVLHVLIGGMLIFTGLLKVFGSVPPEALVKYGLAEQARLIGAGAIFTALLLLIPRTSSLGTLLVSSFWGGAICIHMAHCEPYLFQGMVLALSWLGAYLRNSSKLRNFSGRLGRKREVAQESEFAVP
jgi:hypothetical protein